MFRETDLKRNHTLFAPGGDRGRAVVRMGVITISRIAKQIIAVFDCSRPVKDQFEFFRDVRFFPKQIFVCLNKYDTIPGTEKDRKAVVDKMKSEIVTFFSKRKITIKEFHITCAENVKGMEGFNDAAAVMILQIATYS